MISATQQSVRTVGPVHALAAGPGHSGASTRSGRHLSPCRWWIEPSYPRGGRKERLSGVSLSTPTFSLTERSAGAPPAPPAPPGPAVYTARVECGGPAGLDSLTRSQALYLPGLTY